MGCYPAMSDQFDMLLPSSVNWEPYTAESMMARYPGGMFILCARDSAYWMTKSKIIFDMQVEEMAQQRVMRLFGLRQWADPPPTESPVPAVIHKYVNCIKFLVIHIYCNYVSPK